MARFRRFDAELSAAGALFSETERTLRQAAARPVAVAAASEVDTDQPAETPVDLDGAARAVARLLDCLATLIRQLDAATEAVETDLRALVTTADKPSLIRRFAAARALRKARAQLEEMAPRARLAHLLAVSDKLADRCRMAEALLDECHRRAEDEAERAARRAVKLATTVAGAEKQGARLDVQIAELEARFAPETGSEAAVDLARSHAELVARRTALTARVSNLDDERAALAARVLPLRRLLIALGEGRKALRVFCDKLLCDTERQVVLGDGADAILAAEFGFAGAAAQPQVEEADERGTKVQALFALRRKGVLAMRDITRRRDVANATFEGLFADPVQAEGQAPAEEAEP